MPAITYKPPTRWIQYRHLDILQNLTDAKAAVIGLKTMPYQKRWVDELQEMQLKREVAGTSRIEGADFTEAELDQAMSESPEDLITRSQRQAAACKRTYNWINELPDDRPIDGALILEVHRKIVTGADDDHCPPGKLRDEDHNVIFGSPRHRGVSGGHECESAFNDLCAAVATEFKGHDPLIQALALHYHFAAMHPFEDGNGRTARALEALALQRDGLRDALFIAMSNYYYEEKVAYLGTLAQVRAEDHDLTVFLNFALKGITQQCTRLSNIIKEQMKKVLFKDVMYDLFGRMKTERKRVIAKRQIELLNRLLSKSYQINDFWNECLPLYTDLMNPNKAFTRDSIQLLNLNAIGYDIESNIISINLDWPTEITETEFFERVQQMPKAKTGLPGLG